ncbi:MAG: hypothetical protein PHY28_10105 [Dehalococcoidales bacterium]|nr:hypothetical protein [Dehalococcoidales bacterium]
MENFEDRALANCVNIPELQNELCRIENELDIESTIEQQCLRLELAEYEKARGIDYADGFLDGWNRCMASLIDYHKSSEVKYKKLESQHPEWFASPQ